MERAKALALVKSVYNDVVFGAVVELLNSHIEASHKKLETYTDPAEFYREQGGIKALRSVARDIKNVLNPSAEHPSESQI